MTSPARTVEALRAEWTGLKRQADEIRSALLRLDVLTAERELECLIAEDRSECPRAMWIRCWLAGDTKGCDHWLDVLYPKQKTSEAA